ncbi:ArnT family glycosyltransferase [Tenggerimyces flavus]|uniref:ArnT family glycosyltransferase n=1 Tax=Tenggerimyces flavus TaxID=1708749 RepID=A0ABV7YGP2_9ACTN|nr:glycosyltransferase family 39 protein [Tenggerimyces flavus]MBM7784152.1 hypothetical protein [Tenggerimyces flavus]
MVSSAAALETQRANTPSRGTTASLVALVAALATSAAKLTDLLLHAVAIDRSSPAPLLWLPALGWLVFILLRGTLPAARPAQLRAVAAVLTLILGAATVAYLVAYGLSAQSEGFDLIAATLVCVVILCAPARTLDLVNRIRLPTNADLRGRRLPSPRTLVLITLAATVVVWFVASTANLYIGHDESVYANKSRSWITDLPDVGFMETRPLVLPALGSVALAIHNSLFSFRVVGLLLTLGTLLALYLVGAKLASKAQAALTVLVVLSMAPFVVRMSESLTDIPSSGLLLVVAYLVIRTQERPYLLFVAAGVALLTFYLRYGAISGIAAIVLAAFLAYGWRSWWQRRWHVLGAAVIFLGGMVPHFLHAQREFDSPLGIMTAAGTGAGRQYIGQGLVDYVRWLPDRLGGDLGGVLILSGLLLGALLVWRLLRGRIAQHERWIVVLTLASSFQFLLLGISSHGEQRFVFFAIMALTLFGIHLLATRAGKHSGVLLVIAAVLAAVQVVGTTITLDRTLEITEARRGPLVQASKELGLQHPCTIVGPSYTFNIPTEVGWYAKCSVLGFSQLYRLDKSHPMVIFHYPSQPNPAADAVMTQLIGDRPVSRTLYGTTGDVNSVEVVRFR